MIQLSCATSHQLKSRPVKPASSCAPAVAGAKDVAPVPQLVPPSTALNLITLIRFNKFRRTRKRATLAEI
jgi:hypothetical protein